MAKIEWYNTVVMAETGKKYAASVSQIAMAWAVAKGTVPIIGVTKASQVAEAAKVAINKMEAVAASTDVDTKGNWENPMI